MKINFRKLALEDCKIIHKYLQLRHIREFWEDGHRTLSQVINNYYKLNDGTKRYIYSINNIDVGYIQSYIINPQHEYAVLAKLNANAFGIDFFIGDIDYLNKGHACKILKHFILEKCKKEYILIDPIADNFKALHIYQKFGFIKVGQMFQDKKLHYLLQIKFSDVIK